VPATSVYNFGASILRATGNSRAPLFILGTTGLVNVVLNLIFVIGFGMSVDGVGIATVVSQYLSAITVVVLLMKRRSEPYGLKLRSLAIDKKMMLRILRLGLPAGIQSSMFSIANMVMINAINTFPTATVTGYTVASNIDGVVFTAMSGFGQAAMTFTGQNYGARKPDRIKKSMLYSMLQELIVASVVAAIEFILMQQLIGLYVDDAKAEATAIRAAASSIMTVMLLSMPISAIQDSLSGILKGLGYSVFAMVSGLIGICGVRMVWIWCFFPMERFHNLGGLYLAFPISWGIASLMMAVCALFSYRKLKIKFSKQKVTEGAPDRVE
jgi:putative MATE family efflux protein